MTCRSENRAVPDHSASATAVMIHDLSINKRTNGEAAALRDAEAFAKGCLAFIAEIEDEEARRDCLQRLLAEFSKPEFWQ